MNEFSTEARYSSGVIGVCAYLALTESPEVDSHSHKIVNSRVRSLIQQQGRQTGERIHHESRLHTSMHCRPGKVGEGPFPCETEDTEEKIYDLEDGGRLDGTIEVLCQEIPKDFWPEEALEGGSDLVCQGG